MPNLGQGQEEKENVMGSRRDDNKDSTMVGGKPTLRYKVTTNQGDTENVRQVPSNPIPDSDEKQKRKQEQEEREHDKNVLQAAENVYDIHDVVERVLELLTAKKPKPT